MGPALVGLGLVALLLVGVVALAPGVLVLAYKGVDPRHRAYARFYDELEVGMTRAQVWGALERVYPADGARTRPTVVEDSADRLGFFMHAEGQAGPNCEGIFLTLEDGVVVERDYGAD